MDYSHTIVEYFAEHERYKCGYCKSPDTNFSHGMWAHAMTCQDYEDLIDRGWRRSGKYCYKPTMNMTCCPMYTIKCKAVNFQMSKSHKKVIKRVNKFLITGNRGESDSATGGEREPPTSGEPTGEHSGVEKVMARKQKSGDIKLPFKIKESSTGETFVDADSGDSHRPSQQTQTSTSSASNSHTDQRPSSGGDKRPPKPGAGADPSKPACKKAKQIRLERRLSKKKVTDDSSPSEKPQKQNEAKTLEDLLNEPNSVENCAHRLEIRLVRSSPRSPLFTSSFDESHKVYNRYQMKIHGDPPGKANPKQYTRFLCDSPLAIRLYRSSMEVQPFLLSFQESYSVYQKYQMAIHNDSAEDCDKVCFKEFLIDSPFEEEHREGAPTCGYGSFHQQYLLDGKIIAVGVVDILPHCMSSVYLYYDPDYDFLSLGNYSALREVAFVRELNKTAPALENYYMGFYIHSCPKMRYKGKYSPSFLACPETYNWVPFEKCRPLLDANNYSRFDEEGVEDKDKMEDISQVLVLFKNTAMPYGVYRAISKSKKSDEDEVKEYASFVGKPCAERMFLVRSK